MVRRCLRFFVSAQLPCLLVGAPLLTAQEPPGSGQIVTVYKTLAEREPLKVGVSLDNFPYGFLDQNGRPSGFHIEVLDAIARTVNLQLEYVPALSRERHERFLRGEYDLIQTMSQTAERDVVMDFSVSFLQLQSAIFVQRKGSPIRRLEDFNGRKFVILAKGGMAEEFLRHHGLRVELVVANRAAEALELVDRGEAAGVFISQLTALSVIEKNQLKNVVRFGQPLADYDFQHRYAVHKGDAALLARLNEGLATLNRTGEFEAIYARWFGRLNSPLISREQLQQYSVVVLGLALLSALIAYFRQRTLHRRIATQAGELARQQALLRAIYDNIPLGVCLLEEIPGQGHRILLLNRPAEVLLGQSQGVPTGLRLEDLSLEAELAASLREFLSQAGARPAHARESRHLRRSGRHLMLMQVPLPPSPEGRARCCLIAEDTTDRHRLDDEVAQSRKLRAVGELVGGIAHEFNNLLTPILLKSGEIVTDRPHDQDLAQSIGLISNTAQRAAELTRRLLTFGRKSESRPEVVRVAVIIDSCFALLRLTMDRRIQWQSEVAADVPPLYLNATDLNQILVNLILNARDTLLDKLNSRPADDWSAQIRVVATALPADARDPAPDSPLPDLRGWVRLVVQDNGMGIPAEVRERIYEPFFTTKAIGHGTGLGLATVWHLVQLCGGHIEVDSLPGEGTSFHIYLPVLPAPAKLAGSSSVDPIRAAGEVRIFIAEDDDFVAQTVAAILKREGHTVHREPDGVAAWNCLEQRPDDFDLLVLDINMPGMSGIDVLRRVREAKRYQGPVLVMSGRLGSEEMQRLTACQVDAVINKPFELTEFIAAVRRVVSRRRGSPPTGSPRQA